MIYNSDITYVYESDIMSLLENTEDRFKNDTMAEAIAITLGEQEENWTRFMKGIGFSELSSIMEGEEVIYEGSRLNNLFDKIKDYLERALSKLADITKTFLNKISQFATTNNQFLKMYKSKLLNLKNMPNDLEIKGYNFSDKIPKPEYNIKTDGLKITDNAELLAKKSFIKNINDEDSFKEKLIEHYFGDKDDIRITYETLKSAVSILEKTKELKNEATKSYKQASTDIKKIINKLKTDKTKFLKSTEDVESDDSKKILSNNVEYDMIEYKMNYWKSYASCCHMVHGTYMRALGTRVRQAKAICTKALNASIKETGKNKREKIKARTEGFIDTDVFLGGVEFI